MGKTDDKIGAEELEFTGNVTSLADYKPIAESCKIVVMDGRY